jgi:hypothetical protein
MSEGEIINKVATSGLITLEMDSFLPKEEIVELDIAPQLWQGLALKEKDFRQWGKEYDWNQYQGKAVAVFCSADAIIPHWAFMLISSQLNGIAAQVQFGNKAEAEIQLIFQNIDQLDLARFEGQRVIVKGCGKKDLPFSTYGRLTHRLTTVVKSLMFGEPCSTVPVFKRK